MCVGDTENADRPGADVPPPRSPPGGKKAAVAVAHKILVIVYHLLAEGTFHDEERDARRQPREAERQRKRAIKALEQRGYQVTVAKVT